MVKYAPKIHGLTRFMYFCLAFQHSETMLFIQFFPDLHIYSSAIKVFTWVGILKSNSSL